MHIWHHKRPEPVWRDDFGARTTLGAGVLLTLLAGCASPGPPLPPSLKLPAVITANELTATRVGDTVRLHWTTPTRTTDKLLIAGPITAVVCRDTPAVALNSAQPAPKAPCTEVERQPVTPGATDATDALPAALTAGPARLLAYRVELLNATGHTAGPSPIVYAVAGIAPDPVANLRAEPTRAGALLRWLPQAVAGDTVELTRTTEQAPAPKTSAPKAGLPTGIPGTQKERAVTKFVAGATDAGGTLDRSARIGYTYTYTAQRVRTISLANQSLELRSAPTEPATVAVRDAFPPEVPAGLVAVPGFSGETATQRPTIDLSWEPDIEPRIAGYRVYRREGDSGAWQPLTPNLVPAAAYRDATVVAGHTYTYRVTAVSSAGNESAPSPEATETAPAP